MNKDKSLNEKVTSTSDYHGIAKGWKNSGNISLDVKLGNFGNTPNLKFSRAIM